MTPLLPVLRSAFDPRCRDWADNSFIQRNRPGFDTVTAQGVTHLSLKGLLYESDPHEILVSAGLTWGIGNSGSKAVDAGQGDHLEPGLFFGKGFGDLRGDLSWLRPFAITGAISAESPLDNHYGSYGLVPGQAALVPIQVKDRETLHWGFSIQYSTLYINPDFGLFGTQEGAAQSIHPAYRICLRFACRAADSRDSQPWFGLCGGRLPTVGRSAHPFEPGGWKRARRAHPTFAFHRRYCPLAFRKTAFVATINNQHR
jgi:hypothetical protein